MNRNKDPLVFEIFFDDVTPEIQRGIQDLLVGYEWDGMPKVHPTKNPNQVLLVFRYEQNNRMIELRYRLEKPEYPRMWDIRDAQQIGVFIFDYNKNKQPPLNDKLFN